MTLTATLKRAVLPAGTAPRTVKAGIARGVRMNLDFAEHTRMYLGLYELEIDRHLRRILAPGVSCFDVGAQHGYDALAMAKRTGARIAAFECQPSALAGMQASFALNPALAGLIEPVHAMVGNAPGCLGLDEWAYGPGFVPDFIKVDIEGAEVDALRSAERILSERRPPVIIEVHSRELETEAGSLLVAKGYRPIVVSQRTLFPDLRPDPHNRWLVTPAPAGHPSFT
jgi:hypothetical protein